MTLLTYSVSTTLITEECYSCHCIFAMPTDLHDRAQRDHSIPFWCPNGHRQVFAGKTVEQKLRERVEAEQLRTRQARDQAEAAERTARAYTGQATKIKRRVLRGVCPFCDRSFENVTRHMESKHSDKFDEQGVHVHGSDMTDRGSR